MFCACCVCKTYSFLRMFSLQIQDARVVTVIGGARAGCSAGFNRRGQKCSHWRGRCRGKQGGGALELRLWFVLGWVRQRRRGRLQERISHNPQNKNDHRKNDWVNGWAVLRVWDNRLLWIQLQVREYGLPLGTWWGRAQHVGDDG